MSTVAECMENIIGLSETECECFEEDKPIDAAVSKSKIFLFDLEGLNLKLVGAAADCESGNVWKMGVKAVREAIRYISSDLPACIRQYAVFKRTPLKLAEVGDPYRVNGTVHTLANTYHGMGMYMADIAGGYFKVKKIGAAFNMTTTIDVSIYNVYEDAVIATISVPTVAGKLAWFTLPSEVELDMQAQGSQNQKYLFLYTPAGGIKALNSRIYCPTCGTKYIPTFDCSHPQFESAHRKDGFAWANWAVAGGVRGNDLTERNDWTFLNATQGLIIAGEFGCKVENLLCTGDDMDFTTDPINIVLAHAVRYRAGAYLIDQVLSSGNINRYTTMDNEALAVRRNSYMVEYSERVRGFLCPQMILPENININSDCFMCKDDYGVRMGGNYK